jgi:hypothetical protein
MQIGSCGTICGECPTYLATAKGDEAQLAGIAKQWSQPGCQLKCEDMPCDGCNADRVFAWAKGCAVRDCATKHRIVHCGDCDTYPCQVLRDHWNRQGKAGSKMKANLEMLRAARQAFSQRRY